MKYRHLNKVPAAPQEFTRTVKVQQSVLQAESETFRKSDTLSSFVMPMQDDTTTQIVPEKSSTSASYETCRASLLPFQHVNASREMNWHSPIRRDWSLLIGLIFLAGGLIALSMCIFFYPFAGLNFLWMIVFELLTLYAAWRLLGSGIVYFITRFRSRKNFSER